MTTPSSAAPAKPLNFVYFGTSLFSVNILDELKSHGYVPSLIISTPDKPRGRKLIMTPTPVKEWALAHNVPIITPNKPADPEGLTALTEADGTTARHDLYIVASYGRILPQRILDLPKRHVLNVHPSLLPKYRGASPLQSAILADESDNGITIMRLDAEMDHGPILAQAHVDIDTTSWPYLHDLKTVMAKAGGRLLAELLPAWMDGTHLETEQNHTAATYTKKIIKEDGLVDLAKDDPRKIFLKVRAFTPWPSVYFFTSENVRVKITSADWNDDKLVIQKVIPEGRSEMTYVDFLRSTRKED